MFSSTLIVICNSVNLTRSLVLLQTLQVVGLRSALRLQPSTPRPLSIASIITQFTVYPKNNITIRIPTSQPFTMCYHKYTHYHACTKHVPIHTHLCPKNVTEDATRVIFCEDYRTDQVTLTERCPYCPRRTATSNVAMVASKQVYLTPTARREDSYTAR